MVNIHINDFKYVILYTYNFLLVHSKLVPTYSSVVQSQLETYIQYIVEHFCRVWHVSSAKKKKKKYEEHFFGAHLWQRLVCDIFKS